MEETEVLQFPDFATKDPVQFSQITGERYRTYIFKGGGQVSIPDVVAICVRPSGNHRLNTKDGKKWIIPAGWLAIKIDAETWSL